MKGYLIKVVKGYRGSKRITIPKKLAEELQIDDYVIIQKHGDFFTVAPAEIKVKQLA